MDSNYCLSLYSILYNSFSQLSFFLTFLDCIQGDHATMHYKGTVNVYLQCMDAWLSVPRYNMPIIVSSYQHCDEQQLQTLLCTLHTLFSVINLDLIIQALLLDYILALGKKYTYALRASYFYIEIFSNIFNTKYITKSTSVS